MNNEEKILAMLEKMDSRLDSLEAGQASLQQGQSDITDNLKVFSDRLDSFEERIDTVNRSQINVENDLTPKIKAAFDGFSNAREKNDEQDKRLTVLEGKAENYGDRILAIEYALKAE